MATVLRVRYRELRESSARDFDLRDLLALIPRKGPRLSWRVFPIKGELIDLMLVEEESAWPAMPDDFFRQVDASEDGVPIAWDWLVRLGDAVFQTGFATFLACADDAAFEGLGATFTTLYRYIERAEPAFYERVEIAFQSFDWTFWWVYAKDDALRERIRTAFPGAETVEVG